MLRNETSVPNVMNETFFLYKIIRTDPSSVRMTMFRISHIVISSRFIMFSERRDNLFHNTSVMLRNETSVPNVMKQTILLYKIIRTDPSNLFHNTSVMLRNETSVPNVMNETFFLYKITRTDSSNLFRVTVIFWGVS